MHRLTPFLQRKQRIHRNKSSLKHIGLGVILLLISSLSLTAVYTYTRGGTQHVYAATPSTLNFQARLQNGNGAIVADGSYTVQFKLYDAVSAGTNEWTETQSVTVKAGYLSVQLGSVTPFGSVDWTKEHWLTMNVNADGEMNPRIKLTAVPFAFAAAQAAGLVSGGSVIGASGFAQLAPAGTQSLTSTVAGLRFNQLGSGGLLQLASAGVDKFTVSNTGDASFGGGLTIAGSSVAVGSASQSGLLVLNDGAGGNTSFQANPSGLNIITGGNLALGTADSTGTLLVLDSKTGSGDPVGVDGAMYYNVAAGKFRCYQNGQWQDCINGSNYNATASIVSGLANVAANSAGVPVEALVFTSATAVSNIAGSTGWTAPAAGSFRTCLVKNNAAITNGTLSVRWRVNGASVGAAACTMTSAAATNRQAASSLDPGMVSFNAGDTIGIAFDTNAAFAPATNDFTVYWTVEYNSALGGGAATPSLQLAYNNSVANEITLDNTRQGLTILDNATPVTGNLFEIKDNTGSTTYFGASATGTTTANTLTVSSGGLNVTGNSTISGALAGLTGLTVASGGASITGNSTISGTLSGLTGLTVASGGASVSGGLSNNSGGITNAGSITGIGASLAASGALTITSGGAGDLSLDSASGITVIGSNDTALRRIAAGTYTMELNDAATTTLAINNTGAGAANLNLVDGGLQLNSTLVLSSARALSNLTGINSSGTVTFGGLTTGLVKSDASGNLANAIAGTDYENPLTFGNGLTRTGNAIGLGGNLTSATNIGLNSNALTITGSGSNVISAFAAGGLEVRADATAALAIRTTAGTSYFTVNTTGNLVQIGASTTDAVAILSVLDSFNGAADPTGVNGASYYNTSMNAMRCFEAGAWRDCLEEMSIPKAADQTVTNNATFQNDTALVYAMAANTSYSIDAAINFSGTSAAADYKYTFTAPAGAAIFMNTNAATTVNSNTSCNISASGQTCTVAIAAGFRGTIMVTGYVRTGVTAGSLQFQFAQNAGAGGQSVTVYQGSMLAVRKN